MMQQKLRLTVLSVHAALFFLTTNKKVYKIDMDDPEC